VKVVFLDFDGVLNGLETREPPSPIHPELHLNPALVAHLNQLLARTRAVVVLSTSWRYRTDPEGRPLDLQAALTLAGFQGQILGATPDLRPAPHTDLFTPRAHEIRAWLDATPCHSFVILDDFADAAIEGHFIHVDRRRGLTNDNIDVAVRILNGA